MPFNDPPEPPENDRSTLRAKDLKGRPCILRPVSTGAWPAKPAYVDEQGKQHRARDAEPYIECDVWTFDRAGVDTTATGVRVGWWRAVAQLEGLMGELVACRPSEQDDRSIVLAALTGEARKIAEQVVAEIEAGQHSLGDEPDEDVPPPVDYSDEPF